MSKRPIEQGEDPSVPDPSIEEGKWNEHLKLMINKGEFSVYQLLLLSHTSRPLRNYVNTPNIIDKIFQRETKLTMDDRDNPEYKRWNALMNQRPIQLQILAAYIMSKQASFQMVQGNKTISYKVQENPQTSKGAVLATLTVDPPVVPVIPNNYIRFWKDKVPGKGKVLYINRRSPKNFLVYFIYDYLDNGWFLKAPCAVCGRIEANYVCSKCIAISYCSQDCQNQDWYSGFHQKYCQ